MKKEWDPKHYYWEIGTHIKWPIEMNLSLSFIPFVWGLEIEVFWLAYKMFSLVIGPFHLSLIFSSEGESLDV